MDYTIIIDTIINYASIFMFILIALVFTTNIIVEVIKSALPKLPTSILTIFVAIGVTVLALVIAAGVMEISIMWYYAIGAVVMGIFVAYAAMFGFDKFTDAWEKLKKYKKE